MKTIEKIVLTKDPKILEKLDCKLAEYKKRDEFTAPEVYPLEWAKKTVLSDLLRDGEVSVKSFTAEHNLPWLDSWTLNHAMCIVDGYNCNDISRLIGGTGLK